MIHNSRKFIYKVEIDLYSVVLWRLYFIIKFNNFKILKYFIYTKVFYALK